MQSKDHCGAGGFFFFLLVNRKCTIILRNAVSCPGASACCPGTSSPHHTGSDNFSLQGGSWVEKTEKTILIILKFVSDITSFCKMAIKMTSLRVCEEEKALVTMIVLLPVLGHCANNLYAELHWPQARPAWPEGT
jgi:hypothetical protein